MDSSLWFGTLNLGSSNVNTRDHRLFVLFGLIFYVPANSYGHVDMLKSHNHTFYWASLTKWLTRIRLVLVKSWTFVITISLNFAPYHSYNVSIF